MGNDPSKALQIVNAQRGLNNAMKDVNQQLGLEKDDAAKQREDEIRQKQRGAKKQEKEMEQQERLQAYNQKQQERAKRKEKLKEKWAASRRGRTDED